MLDIAVFNFHINKRCVKFTMTQHVLNLLNWHASIESSSGRRSAKPVWVNPDAQFVAEIPQSAFNPIYQQTVMRRI